MALNAPGPGERRDHDGGEQRREGEGEVGEAHDELVHPAAARGGKQAERHAEADADRDGDHRDGDRVVRARHHHREHVAPERVGAERVQRGGRLQLVQDVHGRGRIGRPGERDRRHDEQQRRDRAAEQQARALRHRWARRGSIAA
jgi:hypothetical protein